MKKFRSSSLQPGMVFTDTVYIDDDTVLVQAQIPLKKREIDLLAMPLVSVVTLFGSIRGNHGLSIGWGTSVNADGISSHATRVKCSLYR